MPSKGDPRRQLANFAQSIVDGWDPATRLAMNYYVEQAKAMTCGRRMPDMTTYILVFTGADGEQSVNLTEFRDDVTVIADARHAVDAKWVSIAIGRGDDASDADWLGVWDWNGGEPWWTPEE